MSARSRFYEFDNYRVDLEQRILLREGEIVSLTPKAFDTLLVFVGKSQHVLEKDTLLQLIWPDTFVEEANLAVNVSLLRKVLGGRTDGGQYIETVPRRGYRFAASVRSLGEDGEPLDAVEAHPAAPPASPVAPRVTIRRPPDIKYAKSGDVNIAYQVVGDGPIDLVFVMDGSHTLSTSGKTSSSRASSRDWPPSRD